jgi:hypothetical protein
MSKQRKLRSKLSFDEDEAGDEPPPPPPAAGKKDSSKPKKSSLLSFGDDEEGSLALAKPKKDKAKVSKFHRANISGSTSDGATAAAAASARPSAGKLYACAHVYNSYKSFWYPMHSSTFCSTCVARP